LYAMTFSDDDAELAPGELIIKVKSVA
jgi:hypothetical protein